MATNYIAGPTVSPAGRRLLDKLLSASRWESYPNGVCGYEDRLADIISDAGFRLKKVTPGCEAWSGDVVFDRHCGTSPAQYKRAVSAMAAKRNNNSSQLNALGYNYLGRRL